MNKFTLFPLLSLVAFSASATDSIDLQVKGKLTNGSCTPSLSDNGVIDFGDILLSDLSKTETNQLGSIPFTLTITCDSATMVSWVTVDNRADSVAPVNIENATGAFRDVPAYSPNQFGLGKTADGVNIGAYAIAGAGIVDFFADGMDAEWVDSFSNGDWVKTIDWVQRADGSNRVSLSDYFTSGYAPVAAQTFSYLLKATAAIQGTDVLNITDNTSLDGSATISLVYL